MTRKASKDDVIEKIRKAEEARELGRQHYAEADRLVKQIRRHVKTRADRGSTGGPPGGANREAQARRSQRVLPGCLPPLRAESELETPSPRGQHDLQRRHRRHFLKTGPKANFAEKKKIRRERGLRRQRASRF